ncbi:DUF4276 family protein [Nodularia spumigena]|uniref:DUF4276 family protein n=1 Tax=Nodularia spumigena TaxID=70799 RepID=UPI00232C6223|nr:DUF4276 family protein [Nodularia spumigena]MDB9319742.1 DUF4276 family protein [Nodularia spumigena CS-590/01A]MDB9326088.1 DUF4276 family protein [Nodularia spumigena CS-590/02]MDB9336721.1 DUF4276 family protein [Nodularia spumigena CS-590/01]
MKIAILVEGATEKAFKPILTDFLKSRLQQRKPRLQFIPYDGRIPKEEKLKRIVTNLLTGKQAVNAVIALTDVYTGTNDFQNAADAKDKMTAWVGNCPNFYPHAAQYDFEAWLLPYWKTIQDLAQHNKSSPGGLPEQVNHNNPPSYRIKEIFEIGKCKRSYNKIRDAASILKKNDLIFAVNQCSELKAFLNTILSLCEVDLIP